MDMQLVTGIKSIVGWGDDSTSSDHLEKLGGLIMALGLTATFAAKEFLTRASDSDVDRYIINVTNFLQNCKPLDNERNRIVCSADVPQAPSIKGAVSDNLLTGIAACFQAVIILLLIRSVIRTYTTRIVPVSGINRVPTPSSSGADGLLSPVVGSDFRSSRFLMGDSDNENDILISQTRKNPLLSDSEANTLLTENEIT